MERTRQGRVRNDQGMAKALTGQHNHGKLGHRSEGDYESPSESREIHDDIGYLRENTKQKKNRSGIL